MLTTKQKVLRQLWHAIIPIDDLKARPQPFRLLGQDIVLFLDAAGGPAALKDRCCPRTAKLFRYSAAAPRSSRSMIRFRTRRMTIPGSSEAICRSPRGSI